MIHLVKRCFNLFTSVSLTFFFNPPDYFFLNKSLQAEAKRCLSSIKKLCRQSPVYVRPMLQKTIRSQDVHFSTEPHIENPSS